MDNEIEVAKKDIKKVDDQLANVDDQLANVERQLKESIPEVQKVLLREEKRHLWKQKEQLREEKLLLLRADKSGGENRIKLPERTKCDFDFIFDFMKNWRPGTLLNTGAIAVALEDYGGFPDKYFVRLEEMNVFTNSLKYYADETPLRAVIVGSPGVGKSVFLVLLAFYLAHVCSKSVIILRKLKEEHRMTRVWVHVSGKGYCGSRFQGWDDFRGIVDQLEEPLFFLDGFTQEDINRDHGDLGGFALLATSSQYRLKSDDGDTRLILLPAWRPEDLRDYADRMGTFPSNSGENFENAYSYSGGSLREFLNSKRIKVYLYALNSINSDGARNLLSQYGGGSTSQVDTIRKLFVKNRSDPEHYVNISEWVCVVDASKAVRDLHGRLSEDILTILSVAEGIGGAFYGNAFEWYIHKRASCDGGLSFEAWQYDSKSRIGEFDVPGGAAVHKGERVTDCLDYLKRWRTEDKKYWFPDMLKFPNIDSIAKCDRISDGDKDNVEKYLVYIQITTAASHAVDAGQLNTLDSIFKGEYPNRVYVALLPEKASIKDFTLTGDLGKSQIPLLIGTMCSGGRKMKRKFQ